MPPAAGVSSPILWGTEEHLRELFGDAIASIAVPRARCYVWRFRSAEASVDFFRDYYGPTFKAFAAVGRRGREALEPT